MFKLKPIMSVSEAAKLNDCSEDFIRQRITDGWIPGMVSANKKKPTYRVYRYALYDKMGLNSDERIKMSYQTMGLDINDYLVKEKAVAGNND